MGSNVALSAPNVNLIFDCTLTVTLEVIEMAVADIGWATIAANANMEWFIHGWSSTDAVTYSIIAFPGTGEGVPFPAGHATLTQGESLKWDAVDGTFAHKVYIQNNAPFNSCDVHLIARYESL
jgi:hypothetical protein